MQINMNYDEVYGPRLTAKLAKRRSDVLDFMDIIEVSLTENASMLSTLRNFVKHTDNAAARLADALENYPDDDIAAFLVALVKEEENKS